MQKRLIKNFFLVTLFFSVFGVIINVFNKNTNSYKAIFLERKLILNEEEDDLVKKEQEELLKESNKTKGDEEKQEESKKEEEPKEEDEENENEKENEEEEEDPIFSFLWNIVTHPITITLIILFVFFVIWFSCGERILRFINRQELAIEHVEEEEIYEADGTLKVNLDE